MGIERGDIDSLQALVVPVTARAIAMFMVINADTAKDKDIGTDPLFL
jgi:hypothetical protein